MRADDDEQAHGVVDRLGVVVVGLLLLIGRAMSLIGHAARVLACRDM